ncbi:hypothetical protein M2165_002920 [Variovorax sp. TBS-050B]|nr:hypothetical protein [Variovorax sp. TBS-050B]
MISCTGVLKSAHVQAAAQPFGQRRLGELHDQVLALLADVHADLVVRQVDDHAAGVVGAHAEIDVAQRQGVAVAVFGEDRGRGRRERGAGHRLEDHQQRLALDLGLVGGRLLEVQHHAAAFAGLHHVHRAQVALVHVDGGAPDGIGHAGKVERDARRRLDHEAGRQRRERLRQVDADDLGAGLRRTGDRFDGVLRVRDGQRTQCQQTQAGSSQPLCQR